MKTIMDVDTSRVNLATDRHEWTGVVVVERMSLFLLDHCETRCSRRP